MSGGKLTESDERISSGEYERAPCPDCGSVTLEDAETKCRPTQGMDGDFYCAVPEADVDADGYLLRPTALYYKNLDAWVDAQLAKDALTEAGRSALQEGTKS